MKRRDFLKKCILAVPAAVGILAFQKEQPEKDQDLGGYVLPQHISDAILSQMGQPKLGGNPNYREISFIRDGGLATTMLGFPVIEVDDGELPEPIIVLGNLNWGEV